MLPAGTYVVNVDETTLPWATWALTTANEPLTVTLDRGENDLGADFGYADRASVCGTVWEDKNVDQVFDAGEPGIAGVTVMLSGKAAATTTTDADGKYCFERLVPGSYTLFQVDLPGYNSSTVNMVNIVLVSGDKLAGKNFGDWQAAKIGDLVWFDANKNGVVDAGEKGISSIEVRLTGTTLSGKAVDKTVVTDANGTYLFDALEPGAYKVAVVDGVPAGYVLTTPPNPKDVALAYHADALGVDFGYYWPGSIGDTVWWDKNNNSFQDAGEPGLAGVVVNLTGTDETGGAISKSATTDASGKYLFDLLPAGAYVVNVDETTLPAGYVLSTGNEPLSVALARGQNYLKADFGYWQPASICGTVFEDLNKDGVKDAGEPGLPGVSVALLGPMMKNATTAADGGYCFQQLIPGNYVVNQVNIPGYISSTPDSVQVALGAGVDKVVNFGDYYPYGSIGNLVFYDANANGAHNVGEGGIAGVTINLTGTDEYGNAVALSATTAADGTYGFASLKAGSYVVNVDETTLPPNNHLTTGNEPLNVTLARGQNLTDADFGYTVPSLVGWVYLDVNLDGIRQPTETTGFAGVRIELRNAATNALLKTVVTIGATGYYQFDNITTGSYRVIQLDQPAGYSSTSPDVVTTTFVDGEHKAINFGEARPTPTPTNTPTATATATPCAICQPTSTTAPTYTPVPTYTPYPTYTPLPTSHADEYTAADRNGDAAADRNADGGANRDTDPDRDPRRSTGSTCRSFSGKRLAIAG